MLVFRFKLSWFFIHMAYLIMPNIFEKEELELVLIELHKRFMNRYSRYATAKEMFLDEQEKVKQYAKSIKDVKIEFNYFE